MRDAPEATTSEDFHLARERTCEKQAHRGGELHTEDNDSPFVIDGVSYCGRCHHFLDANGRCSMKNERALAAAERRGYERGKSEITPEVATVMAYEVGVSDGRRAAFEECERIAHNERVSGETGTEADEAYNVACDHICEAIRAAREKRG